MLKKIKDFTEKDFDEYCKTHSCNSCPLKFKHVESCLAEVALWISDSNMDLNEEIETSAEEKLVDVNLPLWKAQTIYGADKSISQIMDIIKELDENVHHVEYNIKQQMLHIYVHDCPSQDPEEEDIEIPEIGDEL